MVDVTKFSIQAIKSKVDGFELSCKSHPILLIKNAFGIDGSQIKSKHH